MNNVVAAKELLIVNTGYIKKKFILSKLKRLGYKITCLNKEKNWADKYVDNWIIANGYNHDEAIEKTVNYYGSDRPDGILTFWEDDVLLTSKIVDKLGLIGIPYNCAERVRNKFKFREFCKSNNLPAPNHKFINSKSDLPEIIRDLHFPIVLKPAYGSLTAMVVKVESPDELEKVYNYIVRNISTEVETALNDGLNIFAEEYIDGDEVDIDMILQNGKLKLAIVSDNFDKSRDKFFLDVGQVTPSNLPEEQQQEIVDMAELILEKIGIFNGCVHFEAKYSSNGPVPLEANLRMGGDYVYSYIKSAWNVDLISLSAKVATGEYIHSHRNIEPKKYVIGKDISSEFSGIISELSITDELEEFPFVEDMQMYKEIGDATLVPPEGFETLGWVTVSGQSYPDANDNLTQVLDNIDFSVAKFDYKSFSGRNRGENMYSNSLLNKRILRQKEKVNYISNTSLKELDIALVTNVDKFDNIEKYQYIKGIIHDFEKEGILINYINTANSQELIRRLKQKDYDLVLNFIDHDNSKSALDMLRVIEITGIPFTGADSFLTNYSSNKINLKKLLHFHEIPSPNWDYFYEVEDIISEKLEYPVFLKPGISNMGETIDDSCIVNDYKSYEAKIIKIIKEIKCPVLAEEFVSGKELEVIVIGNERKDLEIAKLNIINFKKNSNNILTRLTRNSAFTVSTKIKQKIYDLISETAMDVFSVLNAKDYLEVEFRLDEDNNPYVIDINVSPFLMLKGRKNGNIDLYRKIIQATIERYKSR
ncbi:ATP-grasp domain-containing protein [Candidatus Dojkabacteria bacterium]|nr:ATP-grasp domain-containing protein [Candidatus Dojkabacteria bacterium]